MATANPHAETHAPGVSVVIPAYNYARYLPAAIESAIAQEFTNLEVLVVDDGSTDNTAELVADYAKKDSRVRYIHQKNAGLPAARNTGIRAARHEFIGLLDADDIWLSPFLRRAMETFAGGAENLGIVASRAIYIDGDDRKLETKRRDAALPEAVSCADILLKTRFSPSAVVARKSAFGRAGFFDEALRSSEDRDMWIRIAANHRVCFLGEPLVLIRRHPGNMSKHADRMKANVRTVINKSWRAGLVSHGKVFFWLRVLSFHYFQNSWRYRDEGRRGKALLEMFLSVVLWPWFARPDLLNEPPLFRLRATVQFTRELARR